MQKWQLLKNVCHVIRKTFVEWGLLALSISNEEMGQEDNPKKQQMTKLLEIASDYWHSEKSQINRQGNKKARKRFYCCMPPELAALRIFINVDNGLLGRKPIKRCHKCYATGHEMKFCLDKKVAGRTPEVEAMIKQRFEQVKAQEINDPLLSRSYKHRHFFRKENAKKRMMIKELKKEERKLLKRAKKQKPVKPENTNAVKNTNVNYHHQAAAGVTVTPTPNLLNRMIQPEAVFQGGAYGNVAAPLSLPLPFLNYYSAESTGAGGEAGNMWMQMQMLAQHVPHANYGYGFY